MSKKKLTYWPEPDQKLIWPKTDLTWPNLTRRFEKGELTWPDLTRRSAGQLPTPAPHFKPTLSALPTIDLASETGLQKTGSGTGFYSRAQILDSFFQGLVSDRMVEQGLKPERGPPMGFYLYNMMPVSSGKACLSTYLVSCLVTCPAICLDFEFGR